MKIKFNDYAPQTVKKYAKIALNVYLEQGLKKFKINRVLFDFSLEDRPYLFAFSQDARYKFIIEE